MERIVHLQNTTLLWHEDNLVSGYPKSNSAFFIGEEILFVYPFYHVQIRQTVAEQFYRFLKLRNKSYFNY
jgi:hypothetical protein